MVGFGSATSSVGDSSGPRFDLSFSCQGYKYGLCSCTTDKRYQLSLLMPFGYSLPIVNTVVFGYSLPIVDTDRMDLCLDAFRKVMEGTVMEDIITPSFFKKLVRHYRYVEKYWGGYLKDLGIAGKEVTDSTNRKEVEVGKFLCNVPPKTCSVMHNAWRWNRGALKVMDRAPGMCVPAGIRLDFIVLQNGTLMILANVGPPRPSQLDSAFSKIQKLTLFIICALG